MSLAGWDFTIADSASYISYLPHGDGGLFNQTLTSWQPYYAASGGFCTDGGNDASGPSSHLTSLYGASLGFEFYGSALQLYGTANCSYDVTVDSTTHFNLSLGDGELLYSNDALSPQLHYVNLTVFPEANKGQVAAFSYANITIPFLAGSGVPNEIFYDNADTSVMHYSGNWSIASDPNVPNSTHPAAYHQTSTYNSSMSMEFVGEAVAVSGFRDWGDWVYTIVLDGNSQSYNGSTMWKIPDALLFFAAGLDPNKTHTLDIVHSSFNGSNLRLNSVVAYTLNATGHEPTSNATGNTPTTAPYVFLCYDDWIMSDTAPSLATNTVSGTSTVPSSKGPNEGLIAGATIGATGGLAILAMVLTWLLRRRRSRPNEQPKNVAPYSTLAHASARRADRIVAGAFYPLTRESSLEEGVCEVEPTHEKSDLAHPTHAAAQQDAPSVSPPATSVAPQSSRPSLHASDLARGAPATAVGQPTWDMNRLAELIAERIDQQRSTPASYTDAPPPEYCN
ncbi:uncharacterized protein FIBRA_05815 [Fibroporia radiculosa]|uniref:Uncharacterized protein n=1 Tax=Fibroporia radiculosa TaxID=599839 RepID=J4IAX5_9APHY|nr:uncharacterized protein FIBRA_05815 [Fibroporia radiculosa]CCM03671.1 predicted protein [Fibroporia radiculosa]